MGKQIGNEEIVAYYSSIMSDFPGIRGLITQKYGTDVLFERLKKIESEPITKVQFDQLLCLQKINSVSDGFFKFYWLQKPSCYYHVKDYTFDDRFSNVIYSLEQLRWGLERVFIDCLFIFGNIDIGFKELCKLNEEELSNLSKKQMFDTPMIATRGKALSFIDVKRNDRYLVSEMACKTLGDGNLDVKEFTEALIQEYKKALELGIKNPKFKDLLSGAYSKDYDAVQMSLFTFEEVLEDTVRSEKEIRDKSESLAKRFISARTAAVNNTKLFLSLVNDLDVYVATSMRTKDNFLAMADFCNDVFKSEELKKYNLRYFDPTISATTSHEDKGLIECLMVKAARMLIYHSGDKDSYGKDAEAAMALCLGKPVIFYCGENKTRTNFFKSVHPLSRLVNFENGVANGIIVCVSPQHVATIILRLLTNEMRYTLVQKDGSPGYYTLLEELTQSVIRVHTNDLDLTTAFWNFYKKGK